MSAKPQKKDPHARQGQLKGVQRGTTDELEILSLIVANSPNIRQIVLEAARKAKKRQQDKEKKSTPVAE